MIYLFNLLYEHKVAGAKFIFNSLIFNPRNNATIISDMWPGSGKWCVAWYGDMAIGGGGDLSAQ